MADYPAYHTLMRCASHRARQKLFQLLPERPTCWHSWDVACIGGYYWVPAGLVPQALAITGVSRASMRFKYHPCLYSPTYAHHFK